MLDQQTYSILLRLGMVQIPLLLGVVLILTVRFMMRNFQTVSDRLAALSVLPGGAPLARAYRKQRKCRPGQAKPPPGTNLEGAS